MMTLIKIIFTTDLEYLLQTQGRTVGLLDIRNGDFTLKSGQIFLQIHIHAFPSSFIELVWMTMGLLFSLPSYIPLQSIALAKSWGICKIGQNQL